MGLIHRWLQGDDTANSFAVHGREVDVVASSRGTKSPGFTTGVTSPAPSSNKVSSLVCLLSVFLSVANPSQAIRPLCGCFIHGMSTVAQSRSNIVSKQLSRAGLCSVQPKAISPFSDQSESCGKVRLGEQVLRGQSDRSTPKSNLPRLRYQR